MPELIKLEDHPRRDHFRYFTSLPNPHVGVTVNVEVTELAAACRQADASFYLCVMHAVALAADEVPQLRQRIHPDGILQYEQCPTSHIELLEDETYCYCTLHHHRPLKEYLQTAENARRAARAKASIEEDEDVDSMYFVSCLPWLHYTDFVQPTGNDSNPRFSWGKYEEDHHGRLMMPVTVLAHHAMVDGIHLAKFYEGLNRQIGLLAGELLAL